MAELQCPHCQNIIKVSKGSLQIGWETDRKEWLDGARLSEGLLALEFIEINRCARMRARIRWLRAAIHSHDFRVLASSQMNPSEPIGERAYGGIKAISEALCEEPLSDDEIRNIARSCSKYRVAEGSKPLGVKVPKIEPSSLLWLGISVATGILGALLVIGLTLAWD